MNIKQIIREEMDGLDWIKNTVPTRSDKIDFNKNRFETTLDYTDVSVGDKFIPPGGYKVWTVSSMVSMDDFLKSIPTTLEKISVGESYIVYLKPEKGNTKIFRWRKDWNDGKFPQGYRPWKKIISINEL